MYVAGLGWAEVIKQFAAVMGATWVASQVSKVFHFLVSLVVHEQRSSACLPNKSCHSHTAVNEVLALAQVHKLVVALIFVCLSWCLSVHKRCKCCEACKAT